MRRGQPANRQIRRADPAQMAFQMCSDKGGIDLFFENDFAGGGPKSVDKCGSGPAQRRPRCRADVTDMNNRLVGFAPPLQQSLRLIFRLRIIARAPDRIFKPDLKVNENKRVHSPPTAEIPAEPADVVM